MQQGTTLFRRTFDEALTLAVEARNYAAYVESHERERVDAFVGLRMSHEALRVTSRLTQVMAWLLNQRAVHEGDVSPHEVLAEPNRLSVADICLDQRFADDETLPKGLRSLMARSHHLYVRVARLYSHSHGNEAGLGLALTKSLGEMRGGGIKQVSEVGEARRPSLWRGQPLDGHHDDR